MPPSTTYDAQTLLPTVDGKTVTGGDYSVTWSAASEATTYEIQEGQPATLTSFSDGAEDETTAYDNWSFLGDARRSSGGAHSGTWDEVYQRILTGEHPGLIQTRGYWLYSDQDQTISLP